MKPLQEDVQNIRIEAYATARSDVETESDYENNCVYITIGEGSLLNGLPKPVTLTVTVLPYEAIDANVITIWTGCLGHINPEQRYVALNAIGRDMHGWTYQYGVKPYLSDEGELYFGCHDIVPDESKGWDYSRRIWAFCDIVESCWPSIARYVK